MDEEITEETPETGEPGSSGPEAWSSDPPAVEEIDTAAGPAASASAKSVAVQRREEPPPSPLLLDPYEWHRCTITVGYSLLPDGTVSVSVHNHKDEPIVKTFRASDVPLPEKISGVMTGLQAIWPAGPLHVTVVLLPKPDDAAERRISAAVRVASDTPIVQEGIESSIPFPLPILAMLDELKALIPERGLKNIGKNARAKAARVIMPAAKPAAPAAAPGHQNIRRDQMTLF